MQIVGRYCEPGFQIYTAELSHDRFVDIKLFPNGFAYVMQNHDGTHVYDHNGKCIPQRIDENAILRELIIAGGKRI